MCVNYTPPTREQFEFFGVDRPGLPDWPAETWQDYAAPIIVAAPDGGRAALLATYGMVPKGRIPSGVKKYATMNARAETVGALRSYAGAWKSAQLCLVPMQCFYEPNWETGRHVRWRIGMRDDSPFAVAGLWRSWPDDDGGIVHSFTQLTVNADDHDLMRRFHRSADEKRTLVVVPAGEYGAWLDCKDPEVARAFLTPFPSALMAGREAPKATRAVSGELF